MGKNKNKIKTNKNEKKREKNKNKKKRKKKERTAQRFTVDLHSEIQSSFSFFLIDLIEFNFDVAEKVTSRHSFH
jgi:hypothetical protein